MSSNDAIVILSENGEPTNKQVKKDNIFRLEDVNWNLNVTPMSDSHRDTTESRVLYQLKTSNRNSETSTTIMDFKFEELTKFYETLEKIQDTLDELHK